MCVAADFSRLVGNTTPALGPKSNLQENKTNSGKTRTVSRKIAFRNDFDRRIRIRIFVCTDRYTSRRLGFCSVRVGVLSSALEYSVIFYMKKKKKTGVFLIFFRAGRGTQLTVTKTRTMTGSCENWHSRCLPSTSMSKVNFRRLLSMCTYLINSTSVYGILSCGHVNSHLLRFTAVGKIIV